MGIQKVCVCGAGTMGSGITQLAAVAGFAVIQYDVSHSVLEKSRASIEKNLQFLITKGKITEHDAKAASEKIFYTDNINECKADLIIEAVVESKEIKTELFKTLISINGSDTIYATNTSSISVTEIAEAVPVSERVIGLHFFNPAPLMKLVEVVRTKHTSPTLLDSMIEVSRQFGKTPVVCKDVPGFIVNRVARHYYLEAMQLTEKGECDIETIDELMENAGFKMGPFKLMDLIGMDVNYSVSNIVWNALGQPERLRPSRIQKEKVDSGKLGKKTGEGFYKY